MASKRVSKPIMEIARDLAGEDAHLAQRYYQHLRNAAATRQVRSYRVRTGRVNRIYMHPRQALKYLQGRRFRKHNDIEEKTYHDTQMD